jgi:imidazolonepropionase-like amidohydrolase
VVDIGGRTLMPGLIDAHVHIWATDLDVLKLITRRTEYLAAFAYRSLAQMLIRARVHDRARRGWHRYRLRAGAARRAGGRAASAARGTLSLSNRRTWRLPPPRRLLLRL